LGTILEERTLLVAVSDPALHLPINRRNRHAQHAALVLALLLTRTFTRSISTLISCAFRCQPALRITRPAGRWSQVTHLHFDYCTLLDLSGVGVVCCASGWTLTYWLISGGYPGTGEMGAQSAPQGHTAVSARGKQCGTRMLSRGWNETPCTEAGS
jgi:hypothetical protein